MTSRGSATVVNVSFVYGTTLGGPYPNTTASQSKTAGAFNANVTGLMPNKPYYFKAQAVGDGKPVFGAEMLFTTRLSVKPEVAAAAVRTRTEITVDGEIYDWAGISAIVTDPPGDAAGPGDITAAYVTEGDMNLYLRIDVASPVEQSVPIIVDIDADRDGTPDYQLGVNAYSGPGTAGLYNYDTPPNVIQSLLFASNGIPGNIFEVSMPLNLINTTYPLPWHLSFRTMIKTTPWTLSDRAPDAGFVKYPLIPPTVVTNEATCITSNSAVLNGNLTALGSETTVNVFFEYGLNATYGGSTSPQPKNATGTFSFSLSPVLASNTTYHFRAVAVGDGAPVQGGDAMFTTQPTLGKIVFTSNRDSGIYSTSGTDVYIMDGDGANQTRLTEAGFGGGYAPSLSVNGTKIAFVSERDGNPEIYTMNVDASNKTRVTNNTYSDGAPKWSSDGSKIIFSSQRTGVVDVSNIYVMNANGTNETQLTNTTSNSIGTPVWSPDGVKIAFCSDLDGPHNIWVMDADCSNQTKLTNGTPSDLTPTWSPDGGRIAFGSTRDGVSKIYVMNNNGTNLTRLTNNLTYYDYAAVWLPDGRIAFTSYRDGNPEIYAMNGDGSSQTRLTSNTFGDWTTQYSAGPTVITLSFTNLASNSVTLNGNLTSLGSNAFAEVSFQYGQTTAYGNETAAQMMLATGTFSYNLTELIPNTTYHFRAKAGHANPVYGADMAFITGAAPLPSGMWELQTVPSTVGNVILNGSGIRDIAVASDNSTIYVADTVSGSYILKSTDAGQSFTNIQNNLLTVAGATFLPTKISVAPDDVNTIAVAGVVLGVPTVVISKDGGTTWATLPGLLATSAAAVITDIAVCPARSGTLLGREYVVSCADPAALTTNAAGAQGDVLIIGNTAAWASVAAGITGTRDYTTVAVTPNFLGDRAVVAVGTIAGATTVATTALQIFNTATNAVIQTCTLVAAGVFSTTINYDVLAAANSIISSSIALPANFDPTTTAGRRAYIAIASVAPCTDNDVYRCDDNASHALGAVTASPIQSITYSGTVNTGILFAGQRNNTDVKYTTSMTSSSPTWTTTLKSPTSAATIPATIVRVASDFATTNRVFAGTLGNESAFSVSNDAGVSFNGESLINTGSATGGTIQGLAFTPDGMTAFLNTKDTNNHMGVWKSSLPFTTTSWSRIFVSALALSSGGFFFLRVNSGWATVPALFFFETTTVNGLIYVSQDGGTSWVTRFGPFGAGLKAIGLRNAQTVYYADTLASGNIYKSTDACLTWSMGVPAGVGSIPSVITPKANQVIVSGTTVALSIDDAASFTPMGNGLPTGVNYILGQDSNYSTNNITYTADTGLASTFNIFRINTGNTSNSWENMPVPFTAPPGSLLKSTATRSGVLYVMTNSTAVGAMRTLYPTGPIGNQNWQSLTIGLPTPMSRLATSSGQYLWASDSNNIYAFNDYLALNKPVLVSPTSGYLDPVNSTSGYGEPVNMTWNAIGSGTGLVDKVDIEIADAATGLTGVPTVLNVTITPTAPSYNTGTFQFIQNHSYLWRVRAAHVASGQYIDSQWSDPRSFSVQAAAPEVVIFPDPNLEAAIRLAINKPSGDIYQSDLTALSSFTAENKTISNLTGLEYCTNLTTLDLNDNQISDISPLAGLTNLQGLWLWNNRISNISPLISLTNLQQLWIDRNQISDILPLAGLTNLQWLWLYNNQISNISPLAGLTNLQYLSLGNQINQISNISPLIGLTNLQELWLNGNQISNISPLTGLTSLQKLWLSGNQISNISPLTGLTNLQYLGLNNNQISNISPLTGMTNLQYLWLYDNQISNISTLVTNTGLDSGDYVDLSYNYLNLGAGSQNMADIQTMIGRGVNVTYQPQNAGKIVFTSDRDGNYEIYVMNADGSGQTRLTNNTASDSGPALSPDNTRIVFTSNRDGNSEIYVINANGTNETRLTSNSATDSTPCWSPDSAKIAFYSSRDGNNEVYVMDADGGNQTRITSNPASDGTVAWSPDGTRIAFRTDRDGNHEIYVMNANGTNQIRLTSNTAIDMWPVWSPNGAKIAFMTDRDGNNEIYVMNTDGTDQAGLSNNTADDYQPVWLPDSRVAFTSIRDGNSEIYVMNADGSGQTRLTNNTWGDWTRYYQLGTQGGTISGRVYQADGTNPISGAQVEVYQYDSLPGSWITSGMITTGADGAYHTGRLIEGQYGLRARAGGYANEWYNQTIYKDLATPVSVTPGNDTPSINFTLAPGGSVSGYVYQADGTTTIANVNVSAYDAANWRWVYSNRTDTTGHYVIYSLPSGNYYTWASAPAGYASQYYNNTYDRNTATSVSVTPPGDTPNVNFRLETSGTITGGVTDQQTGGAIQDTANGNITLSVGWHRFVYRQEEVSGGQVSRAAFKAPGDSDWRWFSSSELQIKTSPDESAGSGLMLTTKKNVWTTHPVSHPEMVKCVDTDSLAESGWYGQSVVNIVNQSENIHGNDDYYTSHYEGYFYVDTAGAWSFSTDSDDASEIVIDDQVVASWYEGHGSMNRWEHKGRVTVSKYENNEYVNEVGFNVDGNYTIAGLLAGNYRVQARAPGYVSEYFQDKYASNEATPVVVSAGVETPNIDFSLERSGTISGSVYQAGGTTPIIGAQIDVYRYDSLPGSWIGFGTVQTGADGIYQTRGLADGQYGLRARAGGYANEWYNNTIYKDSVTPVTVILGNDTPNINFTLAPGGSISGYVYQSDGATAIYNIQVTAYDAANWRWVYNSRTDTAGHYILSGLPSGNYYTWANAPTGYASQYYNNTYDRNFATFMPVTAPTDTPNVNFKLGAGGTISGRIASNATGLPLATVSIDSSRTDGPGGQGATSDANGNYTITGLPFGQYKVNSPATNRRNIGDDGFITEYYNNKTNSTVADIVAISANATGATGVNFTLDVGGSISGKVTDENQQPIANCHVYANDYSSNLRASSTYTVTNGTYSLRGLPTGSYLVRAYPANTGLNYVSEYYNDTYISNIATPVSVTALNDTPNINFSLAALVARATVEEAIQDSAAWLASQQKPDGSWGTNYALAKTALAVLKLETYAGEQVPPLNPLNAAFPYHANVTAGLGYILSHGGNVTIGLQADDNPDTNGNQLGVFFNEPDLQHGEGGLPIYNTGLCLMAIVGSQAPATTVGIAGNPLNGRTYAEVAQDTVDYLAWAQTDSGYGRGGWNYSPTSNGGSRSDQSNSGWVTLALAYAEAPAPQGFELNVPGFVRSELNIWIDYIQNDVNGDLEDGGADYDGPDGTHGLWVNILKTGNLLQQMAFVGDTAATPRVQDAINYLVRHWNDTNSDPGWRGYPSNYHATYTTMKGLEAFNISAIDSINWFQDFTDALLGEQAADGWWQCSNFDDGELILSTEWALLTLEKARPPTRQAPDLVVIEKHEEWVDQPAGIYKVFFTIANYGNIAAAEGYKITVTVDGSLQNLTGSALEPGATWSGWTGNFTLTDVDDTITVAVDTTQIVDELNEQNNALTNRWPIRLDLLISEKHEGWVNQTAGTYAVFFTVKNNGNSPIPPGHDVGLYIDASATPVQVKEVTVPLAAGEEFSDSFDTPVLISGLSDTVTVRADDKDEVVEVDEFNNNMANVWESTELPGGWNLLSTPVKLDTNSDALSQIFNAASLNNIDICYGWDAHQRIWIQENGTYELLPLNAVYIKVHSGATATAAFIASHDLSSPPSRELERGLNLIGAAPAFVGGEFPAVPLDQALFSIAEAESGFRGYTMVISPGLNQPAWAYAPGGEMQNLLPFKGYWVVMENGDTMYGFSTTPLSP